MKMRAKHDTVTVISVLEQNVAESEMRKKINAAADGCAHDIVIISPKSSQTIKACVKEWLLSQAEDDRYIDFISIGARGSNAGEATGGPEDFLGSVARAMISMRKLNVIFVP